MAKDKEDEYVRLNFTLPPAMRNYVEEVAETDDRSVSSVMREAIRALAEAREEEIDA